MHVYALNYTQLSKTLIVSPEFMCNAEILTVAAMLSGECSSLLCTCHELILVLLVPNVWFRPHNQRKEADQAKTLLSVPEGNHLTLLNVYNNYKQSALLFLCIFIISNQPKISTTRTGPGVTICRSAH